jgi:PAS domain S-box-containing protein
MVRILVVEDDNIVALELRERLQGLGYTVAGVASYGEEAVEKAESLQPDLVLMDIRLRGAMDGTEAAEQIRTRLELPVLYLTAYADEDTLRRAKVTGPYGYIIKPFDETALRTAIEVALYKHGMERRLKESEERYRSLVEGAEDFIVIVDRDLRLAMANRSALETMGLTAEELAGKRPWDFMPGEGESHVEQFRQAFETEEPVRFEWDVGPFGAVRWLSVTLSPIRDALGQVVALTGIGRDVTAQKLAEDQLKQQNEELETAYHQLQTMQEELVQAERLAAMSQIGVTVRHEINNPLTIVLGEAQWLLEESDALSSEVRPVLEEIRSAAARIRDVVRKLDRIEDRVVPYWGRTTMVDIHRQEEG